jgi:hypothetical protein
MTDDELRELIASIAINQKKTDEQLARTDAQLAKTDAQLAKTDAQLAKTDAHLVKMTKKINEVSKLVGNNANNQGEVAEEFFFRSLKKNRKLGGLFFENVHRNLHNSRDVEIDGKIKSLEDEFDIVLINSNTVAIVEVKQKAHPDLVEDMLTRKLPNFRKLFPTYKDFKLYGVIASMVSHEKLMAAIQKSGLFFLTQQGKHIVLFDDDVKTF